MKENNENKFKIGDVLVRKNRTELAEVMGKNQTELAEVIGKGYNQYTIKIKKFNTFNLYAYISDYRYATEAEILRLKIKDIFIKK